MGPPVRLIVTQRLPLSAIAKNKIGGDTKNIVTVQLSQPVDSLTKKSLTKYSTKREPRRGTDKKGREIRTIVVKKRSGVN